LASGNKYEGRTDLGNVRTGDGVRFKGRGLIQTTGRANYKKYSDYRGKFSNESYTTEPNNARLSVDPYEICDTAGLYWISREISRPDINISRIADTGTGEQNLRDVTKNVNGAEDGLWTGLVARRSHLLILSVVLLDTIGAPSIEQERKIIL
jgi:putative chitinase